MASGMSDSPCLPRPRPRRPCSLPVSLLLAAVLGCGAERSPQIAASPRQPLVEREPEALREGAIRIASIFPAYGRFGISGEESHRGVRMAAERQRDLGPIHERPLEILYYRTGSDPLDVREAAERASDAGALAIVGCNASTLSEPIAELAQTRGIPMVSNVSTAPSLTWDPETGRNREFVFRVCHNDRAIGSFLAECAYADLGARRVAVLFDASRLYSRNLAETFIESFLERPGTAVERHYYGQLEIDFRNPLRMIARFGPDVLFLPGSFADASLVAIQARELGLRTTLLGGDSWANRLLFSRGGPSRPAYHADHFFGGGPFRELYAERFGSEPNGGRAALAHDALGVILHAIGNLPRLTDRDLTSSIAHTRGRLRLALGRAVYDGVTGPIAFDEHGDPAQRGVLVKVEDGERTLFKSLESR